MEFIEKYLGKIKVGTKGVIQSSWITQTEEDLGFLLPQSYKKFLLEYEFLSFGQDQIKCIAPPQFRDEADVDILYSYRINLENGILNENQLAVLELDDEIYYFLVEAGCKDSEYKVFLRDFAQGEDVLFANSFTEFLEKILKVYN